MEPRDTTSIFLRPYLEKNERIEVLLNEMAMNRLSRTPVPRSPTRCVILLWYHGFRHLELNGSPQQNNRYTRDLLPGLEVLVTDDRGMFAQADLIVLFNALEDMPPPLAANQALIFVNLEAYYQADFLTPEHAKNPPFHYLVSYSPSSEVYTDYGYAWADAAKAAAVRASVPLNVEGAPYQGGYTIVFNSAHCEYQPRKTFFQALVDAGLPVHFVGACRSTGISPPGGNDKITAIAHYPFCLAVENTIVSGYLTEKLINCILSGSVPVYLGAPNYRRLLPDNTIATLIVDAVNIYSEPDKLVQHLKWMVDPKNAEHKLAYPTIKRKLHEWLSKFTYDVSRFPKLGTDFTATGNHSWLARLAVLHHKNRGALQPGQRKKAGV